MTMKMQLLLHYVGLVTVKKYLGPNNDSRGINMTA